MPITLDMICVPSEDVVARVIEDELIIVPIASGIGDTDEELYTMNETGKAIWVRLDGTKSLMDIALELSNEFKAPSEVINHDVVGLMEELVSRKLVVAQSK